MGNLQIQYIIVQLVVVIMSVSVHELAHAWVAYKLGDDTAAMQGRLTLNPIPLMQAEPIGMVVLPLLGALSGGTMAFARTPVSLHRVNRRWSMRQADFLISVAGPVSNFLLAILGAALLVVVVRTGLAQNPEAGEALLAIAGTMMTLNLLLGFFNLLPVYPLDGFSVIFSVLPRSLEGVKSTMMQYGNMLVLVLFLVGGRVVDPWVRATSRWLLTAVGLL